LWTYRRRKNIAGKSDGREDLPYGGRHCRRVLGTSSITPWSIDISKRQLIRLTEDLIKLLISMPDSSILSIHRHCRRLATPIPSPKYVVTIVCLFVLSVVSPTLDLLICAAAFAAAIHSFYHLSHSTDFAILKSVASSSQLSRRLPTSRWIQEPGRAHC